VFENDGLVELDAAQTLAAAEANEHALITAETRRLHIAAHWADLHPGDAVAGSRLPGNEHPVRLGGSAPRRSGISLPPNSAVSYASPTGQPADSSATPFAPSLGAVSWGRLQTLLEAAIIQADPVGADQQAAAAAQDRFVRLGRSSEHGLKLIIARAAAGDAIWFKASVDRIADILNRHGDTDPVDVRRSKALGILAQPAEALHMLCEHQDDDWDGPAEHTDADGEPSDDEGVHRSLQLTPPPFDPERAQPRAVIYVHMSQEGLTAGTGVARIEDVGPLLVGRLSALVGDRCKISVKPVIDLPAGHTPVDCYEVPVRLREQLQLRYPADVFPFAAGVSRRIDLDHTIPYLSPDEGGPPGQTRIGNLGPHARRNHRHKTHGGWQVRQPEPGTWLWRSPHRRIYLVNATAPIPSAIPSSPRRCGARLLGMP
jgi:hypothetical protein